MSGSELDRGERIRVTSVCEEGEVGILSGNGESNGWKGGCEKLVGLGSESRNSSGNSRSETLT